MGVPQGSIHGPVLFIVKAMGYVDDNKSNVFKSLSINNKLENLLIMEELHISSLLIKKSSGPVVMLHKMKYSGLPYQMLCSDLNKLRRKNSFLSHCIFHFILMGFCNESNNVEKNTKTLG